MNTPERSLGREARSRLDEYLDAVEWALADSGMSRTERRAVCDEIDAQACEMVFERAGGEPTEQDMTAVLAELDDPEAYRASDEPCGQASAAVLTANEPRVHPFGLSAFLLPFVVVALIFVPFPRGEQETFIWWAVVSFLCVVLAGWALHDIRHRPGRYRGTGLAVFGMLAVPMMVLSVFTYLHLERLTQYMFVQGGEIFGQRERDAIERWSTWEPAHGAILIVLLLALNAVVFWFVYRRCRPAGRPAKPGSPAALTKRCLPGN